MKSIRSFILVCALFIYAFPVQAAESDQATGTVAESISSGGYVYLRLEEQGIWLAANAFEVMQGDKIQYSGGMEMKDFYSKTLDRTFESIRFVQNASLADTDSRASSDAMMKAHANAGMQPQKPLPESAPAPGEIEPLKGGETVASIFVNLAELDTKTISLNAKVIKINRNIMGKNWITLQDGTGTEPDNKILATSQEVVSPGDIVVVRGTVATDVDLGFGYQYKILLEEASFATGME